MTRANIWHEQLSPDLSKMVFVVKSGQTWTKRPTRGRAVPPLCLKMADKYHQHLRGGIVGKLQKFGPFSNNLLWLFENGRKQTINHLVGTLLENGRNFGRFPTTGFRPFSNNPKCFGRFPTKRFRPFSYNFFRPFSTSPYYHVPKFCDGIFSEFIELNFLWEDV